MVKAIVTVVGIILLVGGFMLVLAKNINEYGEIPPINKPYTGQGLASEISRGKLVGAAMYVPNDVIGYILLSGMVLISLGVN
jgi:hypothetical protein